MTSVRPLADVGVLVTRPAAQAANLLARLRDLGATPLVFPALEIQPPSHPEALASVLDHLVDYDLAIFISPTAAERGLAAAGPWPSGLAVAAVGAGTARVLAEAGAHPILVPAGGADSEHLLDLPELRRMAGRRVLIFRGEGGRELLADTLGERGARVDYAECYRRGRPDADPAPLFQALAQGRLDAVTVFSGETLDNLLAMAGDAPALLALPLFAPHPRIAAHARRLGFADIRTTEPGENGLVAGLVEYFAHVRHPT